MRSGRTLHVKPESVSLIRDSLAVVSGTIKDVNRSLSKDFVMEDCDVEVVKHISLQG